MRSVELFAGAGGLGLGCELAGFHAVKVVEWDRWACDTVRENRAAAHPLVASWDVVEGDVRGVDWSDIVEPVDLVTGGPPCQPFSAGGKGRAADDRRDMFPAAIEVIRTLTPRAFILENVRGLTRAAFANYYQYILLQLAYPELASRPDEAWGEHYERLQVEHTSAHDTALRYNVVPTLVNAADYGVPQQRHRVFMVGFRSDIEAEWSFPAQTHSFDSLLYSQWVIGDYWERHKVPTKERPSMPERVATRVNKLRSIDPSMLHRPWRTVRDALVGLPDPRSAAARKHLNHVFQGGAKSYHGHSGSPIDMPAKALKSGVHGVPGGENMLLNPDGTIRYFTVRESARLQTFPERYELHGAWGEAMRQLGNAVPVLLAQKVAGSVAEHLTLAALREAAMDRRASSTQAAYPTTDQLQMAPLTETGDNVTDPRVISGDIVGGVPGI
ncbi:DNA cytosine methyltransferase [Modestobacter versicolor]|uniref:DNA (cytosine-5-)-methyltransferase n=1 Tax=Modestobacter versicolor TaxID=429133 RepID=A0A323VWD6_9ACTN|nr:DNA cytosine methyltransferase [Modestobacter versicolor]MBB3674362.1 DNA (cytosine-5)-methyltransferase 1 [Modestobacter versicolor]PZA23098.1 DNA (cytosine-5-)-methyltransferase [Modestobacter versicolor]